MGRLVKERFYSSDPKVARRERIVNNIALGVVALLALGLTTLLVVGVVRHFTS